jgi:hypothetical protein
MTTATIQTIAIGMISLPQRPQHHEALLQNALTAALAAYSAACALPQAVTCTATGVNGADPQGDYTQFDLPLSSGVTFATTLSIDGQQYTPRLVGVNTVNGTAAMRVYAALTGEVTLTVWRPGAHTVSAETWPPHHEAVIAMLCASFYLNALALHEADLRRAELMQSIAASYYGRALNTLQQI